MRTIRHELKAILVELNEIEVDKGLAKDILAALQTILDWHQAVFNMSMGLPPIRVHEHGIILKDDTTPISVNRIVILIFKKPRLKNWCLRCWLRE